MASKYAKSATAATGSGGEADDARTSPVAFEHNNCGLPPDSPVLFTDAVRIAAEAIASRTGTNNNNKHVVVATHPPPVPIPAEQLRAPNSEAAAELARELQCERVVFVARRHVAVGTGHNDRALGSLCFIDAATGDELFAGVVCPAEEVESCLGPLTGIALRDLTHDAIPAHELGDHLNNHPGARAALSPNSALVGIAIRDTVRELKLLPWTHYRTLVEFNDQFQYVDPLFYSRSSFKMQHLFAVEGITFQNSWITARDEARALRWLCLRYHITSGAEEKAKFIVRALQTVPAPTKDEMLRFRCDGVCLSSSHCNCPDAESARTRQTAYEIIFDNHRRADDEGISASASAGGRGGNRRDHHHQSHGAFQQAAPHATAPPSNAGSFGGRGGHTGHGQPWADPSQQQHQGRRPYQSQPPGYGSGGGGSGGGGGDRRSGSNQRGGAGPSGGAWYPQQQQQQHPASSAAAAAGGPSRPLQVSATPWRPPGGAADAAAAPPPPPPVVDVEESSQSGHHHQQQQHTNRRGADQQEHYAPQHQHQHRRAAAGTSSAQWAGPPRSRHADPRSWPDDSGGGGGGAAGPYDEDYAEQQQHQEWAPSSTSNNSNWHQRGGRGRGLPPQQHHQGGFHRGGGGGYDGHYHPQRQRAAAPAAFHSAPPPRGQPSGKRWVPRDQSHEAGAALPRGVRPDISDHHQSGGYGTVHPHNLHHQHHHRGGGGSNGNSSNNAGGIPGLSRRVLAHASHNAGNHRAGRGAAQQQQASSGFDDGSAPSHHRPPPQPLQLVEHTTFLTTTFGGSRDHTDILGFGERLGDVGSAAPNNTWAAPGATVPSEEDGWTGYRQDEEGPSDRGGAGGGWQ